MTTETTTTAPAEHGASPEPADPLARASREALAMYHAAYEAGRVKEEEFRAAVHPKIWELHNQIEEQGNLTHEASMDLHVAELCRHLPGLAPTIRVMWMHVIDERTEQVGRCCTSWPVVV